MMRATVTAKKRWTAIAPRITRFVLILFVRYYQAYLRPLLFGACKFHPTCSEYSIEAIQRFGAIRGFCLSLRRIGRCHPFTRGGIDPVPDR